MRNFKQFFVLMILAFFGFSQTWAAEGDELAICQGTGSGYGTRRTSTDSHSVGWVLSTGQSGYLGTNNATNHGKVVPTADDLPVVKAQDPDATTSSTGYYFYYTSTAVSNAGAIVFSHTASNSSATVAAYIVSSSTAASEGSATWTKVTLASTSTSAQGASVKNAGTYTFTFNATQTSATYYGVVLVVSGAQRLTAGTIKILEGAGDATLTSITITGTPDKDTYEAGEFFDPKGLVATGNYSDDSHADLTSSVVWAYTPAGALTQDLTSVNVTATKGTIVGNTDVDITVNAHVVTPDEYEIPTNNALWGTSFNGSAGVTTLSGTSHDISITINKNTGSGMYVNDAQTRIYNGYTMVFSVPSGYVITAIQFTADGGNWAGEHTADVGTMTDNKNWSGSSNTVTISIAGTCRMTGVTVTFEAEAADAPSVTISPVAVDATAAAVADGLIDVTYTNIATASATVGLFNDAECNEAFTGDWLTASLNGDKDIAYTINANTAFEVRTAYIKLTAPASNGTSPDVVKVIAVNQAAKEYVFANLAELLENVTPTGTAQQVTVTLTNEVIVGLDGTQGIYLNVTYGPSATTKQIEIYCKNAPTMVAGGTVSGTLENCNWKTYGSTWELCPANWTEITYTAPKAVSSVVVTGTPTKASYVDGEKFNPAGLTVTVNYTDDTHEVIDASMATWAYNPSQVLAKDQTSVGVQATYNEVQSAEYTVSGLTVGEIPTKTVAEFIAAGNADMRCYLVGTVSEIETGTKLKYGNFNLTDASGTIYVYGCLDTEGNAEQFESLDVEDGDKIKVIAEDYEYYSSKHEAKNVQFVQEIVVAKISIDNMSMEYGDVATINAAITPAAAATAVTYAIKAGSDDCITLEGDQVTAKSVAGTATIVATISDAPEYDGAVKEFTITVTAPDSRYTAIIDGITAINGTLVTETAGAHKDKEYISYVAQKGDASNAPIIPSGKSFVRIYQNGGYLALNAVKGCVIDEVIVSIPSTCNSTTIAVGTDEENLPTTGGTAATAGNDFSTGTGLNSQNVYLVCLGTTSSTRLEVGAITVKYTGNPIEVSSIAVGGTYQTEFEKNETFNHDGVVVTATYTDESHADVTALAEFSDPDMTTLGVKTVTVSYGGKSTTYDIEVVAAALSEIQLSGSYPTQFAQGDAFSHAGMTVTAVYSDASETDVTDDATFSGFDMSGAGVQTVTVSYGGKETTYKIKVVPANTDFIVADDLEATGSGYTPFSGVTDLGTSAVYAGKNAYGSTGANVGAIQIRTSGSEEGIVVTGQNGTKVVKSVTVGFTTTPSGTRKLQVYGKHTAYTSAADLFSSDAATQGTLIGEIATDGSIDCTADNYEFIGIRSYDGAMYLAYVMVTWGDASVTPTKEVIRDGLSAGKWGTICPKQTVENVEGASFYQITYLEEQGGLPYNVVFDQIEGTTLTAGQPYFFIAEGEKIKGNPTGAELTEAGAGVNGFYGYIGASPLALPNIHTEYTPGEDNTFVIYNNSVFRINSATNLKSERCYININATVPTRTPSSASPVRRRIVMGVQNTNTATGMDELNASEAPRKMIIDGKMYIFRGEKMYNANGILVK